MGRPIQQHRVADRVCCCEQWRRCDDADVDGLDVFERHLVAEVTCFDNEGVWLGPDLLALWVPNKRAQTTPEIIEYALVLDFGDRAAHGREVQGVVVRVFGVENQRQPRAGNHASVCHGVDDRWLVVTDLDVDLHVPHDLAHLHPTGRFHPPMLLDQYRHVVFPGHHRHIPSHIARLRIDGKNIIPRADCVRKNVARDRVAIVPRAGGQRIRQNIPIGVKRPWVVNPRLVEAGVLLGAVEQLGAVVVARQRIDVQR